MGFYPNVHHLRAVLAPVGRFLKICRSIWACCCAGSPLNIQHTPPPTFRNLSRGFRNGNQSEQRLHSRGDEDEPLASWGRSRKQRRFGVKESAELLMFPHTGSVKLFHHLQLENGCIFYWYTSWESSFAACQQVNSSSSAYGYIVSMSDRQLPIKLPFPTFLLST